MEDTPLRPTFFPVPSAYLSKASQGRARFGRVAFKARRCPQDLSLSSEYERHLAFT